MKNDLTPRQRLAVFSMVFARTADEREPLVSKTLLDGKQWKGLEGMGLVELTKRPKRQGRFVTLTDAGWDWASSHLVGPLGISRAVAPRVAKTKKKPAPPPKPIGPVPVLESVLERLALFLERSGESLASFAQGVQACPPAPDSSVLEPPATRALPDRIRSACLDLAGGIGKRVLLRDLRMRLGDVRREVLDHALLELQERERIVLYRLDNPADLTPADEQAALLIAGNPRHIVYLEG